MEYYDHYLFLYIQEKKKIKSSGTYQYFLLLIFVIAIVLLSTCIGKFTLVVVLLF